MYKQLFSPYNQRNYALTELLSRLFKDLSEAMQKEKKKVFLRLIEKNINWSKIIFPINVVQAIESSYN